MELPTPRITAAVPWLLLLCLAAATGILQALPQPPTSTSGFISIDSGLPGETGYVDDISTLSHTTDAGFIDLYVGVDFWTTVKIPKSNAWVYMEAVVVVPRDSVQVCLVNTGGGVPFISGLYLRPLKDKLYPMANATRGLVLYPDDPYDRLWFPLGDATADWAEISTGIKVEIDDDQFQPPQAVMQTAITPKNISRNIDFTLDLQSSPSDQSLGYIHILYFSELQQLSSSNALREYDIYRNGMSSYKAYTPPYLVESWLFSTKTFQASQYMLSLNATANSTLPPVINAMELFSVIPTTTMSTDSKDGATIHTYMIYLARWSLPFMHVMLLKIIFGFLVSAITAIKEMYQVQKNWMGDPCVPDTLAWDGLTCSYAVSKPPIISNINVSFSGLNGTC